MHCVLTAYVVHSVEPRGFLGPSPSTHRSQLDISSQPHQSPFTTQPTSPPPYTYPSPPTARQMSGSISSRSSIADSESSQSIIARHPFAAAAALVLTHALITRHSSSSGPSPTPPQRSVTVPVPVPSNTAESEYYNSGSPHSNTIPPQPQSMTSQGSPPNTQGWSFRGCPTLV